MTKEQEQYIIDNRGIQTQEQIAAHIGMSKSSVWQFIAKNFPFNREQIIERENYILVHYDNETADEMAAALNIETDQIYTSCKKLGVIPVTKMEKHIYYICKNYKSKTISEMATELGLCRTRFLSICHDINVYPTDIIKEDDEEKKQIPLPPKITGEWSKSLVKANTNEILNRFLDCLISKDEANNRPKRPAAIYNQTGSPLLDDLRGITTTGRENTLYK